jgi:RNA polymerase-interacting CarD/CdnL/TRCF family regulator
MKTVTITQQQWSELNVGLLLQMAEYVHSNHSEDQTREERVSERNDLNDALFQYNKIREAFKS